MTAQGLAEGIQGRERSACRLGVGNTALHHQPYFKFMTTNHHFEIFNTVSLG